jgi:hypothetical protein
MIQLYGPKGIKTLALQGGSQDLGVEFTAAFIRMGLQCNYSITGMKGQFLKCGIHGEIRITESMWKTMTDAMVEIGLLEKKQGSPTIVRFGLPLYPILWGVAHPHWDMQRIAIRDDKQQVVGYRLLNEALLSSGRYTSHRQNGRGAGV